VLTSCASCGSEILHLGELCSDFSFYLSSGEKYVQALSACSQLFHVGISRCEDVI